MKLTELIAELKSYELSKKKIEEHIADTRNAIIDAMHKDGLKQIKTDDETVSIATRVSYDVNEPRWRVWAAEQPDLELDMFYVTTLDKKRVTSHAEQTLKETGEIIPGIEARETEYLSLRSNK